MDTYKMCYDDRRTGPLSLKVKSPAHFPGLLFILPVMNVMYSSLYPVMSIMKNHSDDIRLPTL